METVEHSAQRARARFEPPAAPGTPETDLTVSRSGLASSRHAARFLTDAGMREGDAIAVWMAPGASRFRLMLGAAQLGIWAVPIHPAEPLFSVRSIVRAWKVRLLVVPQGDVGYDYVTAAGALGEVHTELRWAALGEFDVAARVD